MRPCWLFWVIVIALTGSLAGKLMGAEKNDASAYLPASAESTQALKLQDHFTSTEPEPGGRGLRAARPG